MMEDFKTSEENAFVVEEVTPLLKEVKFDLTQSIEQTIQNSAYHQNKIGQWNSNIVEMTLKKLTLLNKPFKYIGNNLGF